MGLIRLREAERVQDNPTKLIRRHSSELNRTTLMQLRGSMEAALADCAHLRPGELRPNEADEPAMQSRGPTRLTTAITPPSRSKPERATGIEPA